MDFKYNLRHFSISLFLLLLTHNINAQTYSMGIFPYFDAGRLSALHQPLTKHLSESAKINLHLISAPNFKEFIKRTKEGRYDVVVTAPHLARIAELKHGYTWLGVTSNVSHAVFVVKQSSAITNIKDLKGKSITLPSKKSIVHHLAIDKMKSVGLVPGKNITIKISKSHNNAMVATIKGVSDASAFGRPTWDSYRPKGHENLNMIGTSDNIPGFGVLAKKSLGKDKLTKLQNAFFDFGNTIHGQKYFISTSLKGARKIKESEKAMLDMYIRKISGKTN